MRFDLLLSCVGSAIDKDSGALSLFNIIDEIQVPAEALGQPVPIETHFHVTSIEESGREVEVRVIWRNAEGIETPSLAPTLAFLPRHQRMKVRSLVTVLPAAFGSYRRHVEWRYKGSDEWQRDVLSSTFVIRPEPVPEAAPVSK